MSNPFTWVTGASSGLGKELAEKLLAEDFNVLATARRELTALNTSKSLSLQFKSDISSRENIADTLKFVQNNDGHIDCLINNAGVTSFQSAEKDSLDDIEQIIQTNLLGPIYAIKAVLPEMIERKTGTIVNILSVVTQKIFTNSSAYSASKAGLLAYTNVLREEVRKDNIRIINIIPGATATPIWSENVLAEKSSVMMHPKELSEIIVRLLKNPNSVVPEEIRLRPLKGDL